MSFRLKLVAVISIIVSITIGLVAYIVSVNTRRAFEQLDEQRTTTLVAQFQREFQRRGTELSQQVETIATSESTLRMALDLTHPSPDYSLYLNEAQSLAFNQQLDFLELIGPDGNIISSAQWPTRFGLKEDWVTEEPNWGAQPAFLKNEELPSGNALAIVAVRTLRVRDTNFHIVGGKRLDAEFLNSLVLPEGMRAFFYRYVNTGFDPQMFLGTGADAADAARFREIIERVEQLRAAGKSGEFTQLLETPGRGAGAESFHTIPLLGRQEKLLGVLMVGNSLRAQMELARHIRWIAFLVGAGGIMGGLLLSAWLAGRVTRPIEELAAAAADVARGDWNTHVEARSSDEVGQLAEAFNHMTRELIEHREKLVQSERVAAWRELARRLAHELKNPLFPLQITIENLLRCRERSPEQFEEVFQESTATLLAEVANLKAIIGRFSDFSKMPVPRKQPLDLNEMLRSVVQLYQAQFAREGVPAILPALELAGDLPEVNADPVLLRQAIENLALNAMDAMPAGGTLTFRSLQKDGRVVFEIADTGGGLTPEECERLFTPYYTTKQHGTGLGLAIVQSIVSDHGGKISVNSEQGRGTAFRIELPMYPDTPVGV